MIVREYRRYFRPLQSRVRQQMNFMEVLYRRGVVIDCGMLLLQLQSHTQWEILSGIDVCNNNGDTSTTTITALGRLACKTYPIHLLSAPRPSEQWLQKKRERSIIEWRE
ncbi:MAG: hypothetical protein WA323_16755 [Candidatus Nitrosopolaris sp.]